jgi:LysM repeat protein
LESADAGFVLKVGFSPETADDSQFDKLTIFHEKGPEYFGLIAAENTGPDGFEKPLIVNSQIRHLVKRGETLGSIAQQYGCTTVDLISWNQLRSADMIYPMQALKIKRSETRVREVEKGEFKELGLIPAGEAGSFRSEILLKKEVSQIYLLASKTAECQKHARIYGLMLENSRQPGVCYNAIGVNGAQARHYNRSKYFIEQLKSLKPDLVIISLGTNESISKKFEADVFYRELHDLVSAIRMGPEYIPILLTTPPDNLKSGERLNPFADLAARVVSQYAYQHQLGLWDLEKIMGGYGSMRRWTKAGLAKADKVHFTQTGYRLQAHLFFTAFMEAYETF